MRIDVVLHRGKIRMVCKSALLCLGSDSVTSKQSKYSIGICLEGDSFLSVPVIFSSVLLPNPGTHVHGLCVGPCEGKEAGKGGRSHGAAEVEGMKRS